MPTTLNHADKLGAVAAAIVTALSGIEGLTAYDHEPAGELAYPALTVGAVTLERVSLEEPEHHLGVDDWLQTWSLTLMVLYDGDESQWATARRLIGEVARAIDFDPHLGGEAREARLVSAEAGYNDPDSPRRMIVVECEVEVLSLMPDPV